MEMWLCFAWMIRKLSSSFDHYLSPATHRILGTSFQLSVTPWAWWEW